jgi:hypothetical protein
MNRAVAIIVLTSFAGGPSLGWLCHHACESGQPVAAADECHRSVDWALQGIEAGPDCEDHASPVALITKRAQLGLESLLALRFVSPQIPPVASLIAGTSDLAFSDSRPPLAGFRVPLRI